MQQCTPKVTWPVLLKLTNMSTYTTETSLRHAHKTSVTTFTILLKGTHIWSSHSSIISKTHRAVSPPATRGCRRLCRQCKCGSKQGQVTQSLFYSSAGNRSKVAGDCSQSCEHALCQGPSGTETRRRGKSLKMARRPKPGELAQGGSYVLWGSYWGWGTKTDASARVTGGVREG